MGPLTTTDEEWNTWAKATYGDEDVLGTEATTAAERRIKVGMVNEDEMNRLKDIEKAHDHCAASRESDNSHLIRAKADLEQELDDTQDELEDAQNTLRKLAVAWKNSHDSKYNEVVLVHPAVSSIVETVDPDIAHILEGLLSEWGPSL